MSVPPRRLSRELREGTSRDLSLRRWVVALSLAGVTIGQIVTLYQTGILKRLPDPPVGPFDSDRVNASGYAYKRLQTPDAALMVLTYGATAALAAAGGKDRAAEAPWLPLATAAKAAWDVVTNLRLAREEWADNKALCAYCQTASLLSMATLALTLPEAAKALGHTTGRMLRPVA